MCIIEKQPLLSKIIHLWKILDSTVSRRRWQLSPSSEQTETEEVLWIIVLCMVIITELLLETFLQVPLFFIFSTFWVHISTFTHLILFFLLYCVLSEALSSVYFINFSLVSFKDFYLWNFPEGTSFGNIFYSNF